MAKASRWLKLFEDFIQDLRISSKEASSADERGVKLELWESQRRFLREVGQGLDEGIRIFLCLKSRQLGITTISLAIDLFWLAMHPNLKMSLVTDTEANREENRSILRQYVNSFPENYFGGDFKITDDNRAFMSFSNGSRINLLVAGTRKKTISWAEGKGNAAAHLTEISKYGDPDGLASFEESFSESNPDRIYIFESTANGFNHWRDKYLSAKNDKFRQRAFFIGWWASDVNVIPRSDPRFPQYKYAATGTELELVNQVARDYNHRITPEQLAWIRYREEKAGQATDIFDQNQPWCVAAGTRVGTRRGILKIVDVVAGDVCAEGDIEHVGATGVADIWRARTRLGYQIEGTANHPLITINSEEVELADSLGAQVRLALPMFAPEPYTQRWRVGVVDYSVAITKDFSRLVGLFMGDGCMSGQDSRTGRELAIHCTGTDRDVIDECHRLIRGLFGVNTQERVYPNTGGGGQVVVRANYRDIYETFKALRLLHDSGRARRRVHVPEFIWRSPKAIVKEFLSGLFEADGHASKKQEMIVFASKHESFVRDVQLLLLGFGITSRIHPVLSKIKRNNDDKVFGSWRMELRCAEATVFHRDIGFLSARKRNISLLRPAPKNPKMSAMRRKPITMTDVVESVEFTGRQEQVYNVTVPHPHWFGANGILTHNTESQAFVQSGYSFFDVKRITAAIKTQDAEPMPYKGYAYEFGASFFDLRMSRITSAEERELIELKVWEEPVAGAQYVIGFDPAWGRNDHKDRSAIFVGRCFADKIVQVAEYATHQDELRFVSWVLAHLAGAYEDCMVNIEVAGPGRAVFQEWDSIRGMLQAEMYKEAVAKRSWEEALSQARWYLYTRADSLAGGYAKGFLGDGRGGREIMHQMRGAFVTNEIVMRSRALMLEMTNVVVDESGAIGAPESRSESCKDDRVFACAHAVRAWLNWRRPELVAQGMTYQRMLDELEEGRSPVVSRVNDQVYRFLKRGDDLLENPPDDRPEWLTERGLA
jgi:intein/homing endonuclease